MYQVRRSTDKPAGDAIDVDVCGLNDNEYRDCVIDDWEVPHENRPAPRDLLLVQGFVNTRDLEEGTDLLQKRNDADAWLTNAGLWCRSAFPSARELEEAASCAKRSDSSSRPKSEAERPPHRRLCFGPTLGRPECESKWVTREPSP